MLLEISNLHKYFWLGPNKIEALRGITLGVEKGDIVCLMGPSGAGKSTLLNLIGGLDRFDKGQILVDGIDIALLDENKLANYRRDKVGFVFQAYNLIPSLSALKNVELPLVFAGVSPDERRERARIVLERLGLGGRINHRPTELSGGEQQRVAIARALINNPLILLADEPTGNLDSRTGNEVMQLLKEINYNNDQTIILVTHNEAVAGYADYIYQLRDGLIVDGGEK
jgi:putative ABC transport system ATP-binding protein